MENTETITQPIVVQDAIDINNLVPDRITKIEKENIGPSITEETKKYAYTLIGIIAILYIFK